MDMDMDMDLEVMYVMSVRELAKLPEKVQYILDVSSGQGMDPVRVGWFFADGMPKSNAIAPRQKGRSGTKR
ncbi:hypothetical protein Dda_8589 [Drechslerella dactyloides]|uniref:Uncharacterized protein n=1 Tax=Drechslerella dactyloides TaxID=74499 RepID=A0AAD6IUL3_DREDA|nr:hypothetical protein Dda_8589 [Drechslerella dactyloides]